MPTGNTVRLQSEKVISVGDFWLGRHNEVSLWPRRRYIGGFRYICKL